MMENFLEKKVNWDKLLGIPDYLIDKYDIFTFADNVNKENNFKVIKTKPREDRILENNVINNFDNGISSDWKFKKSINNIFTEFIMNKDLYINLIIISKKYL